MISISNLYKALSNKSESFSHKLIKQSIYEQVLERNRSVKKGSIEKNFKTRIADIFFKLKDGKEVVVEIQHSGISHKEIKDRTLQYNQLG
ncbi:MAG: hypothetical protein EU541_05065, partial [Promethearchaeota archaeon]